MFLLVYLLYAWPFMIYIHSLRFSPLLTLLSRSQSKNTCAHNNTQKAHANGIKKAKRSKFVAQGGMDPKFLRNQKYAKKYNGSKRTPNDE